MIHVHQTHAKTVAFATPETPGDTIVAVISLMEDHAAAVNLVYIADVCVCVQIIAKSSP